MAKLADVITQWSSGESYEPYVGRWSRIVADEFVDWLDPADDSIWLDVGCGTGALTDAIRRRAHPRLAVGADPSKEYVNIASRGGAGFVVSDAQALPFANDAFDLCVAGLVLNFVPTPETALLEMRRVTRSGGTVAAYFWDFTGRMQMINTFWRAAAAEVGEIPDEEGQFQHWTPDYIHEWFSKGGLQGVSVGPITVQRTFETFEDLWTPFLGKQGPAPSYLARLDEQTQSRIMRRMSSLVPTAADGSITLSATAWAAQGTKPQPASDPSATA